MKKTLFKILLTISLMTCAVTFANVDEFKNNVFKLDFYKTSNAAVNANLYITLPYNSPIDVVKKSNTEYLILMPEVKSSLIQTPDLKSVNELVEKVEIKTQPYSHIPALKGYTKISITTLKPLDITTSIEVLQVPDLQTSSVNAFLDKLDAISNGAKVAIAPPPVRPQIEKPVKEIVAEKTPQKVASTKPQNKVQITPPQKIQPAQKSAAKIPVQKSVKRAKPKAVIAVTKPVKKSRTIIEKPIVTIKPEITPVVEQPAPTKIEETKVEKTPVEEATKPAIEKTESPAIENEKTSLDDYSEEEPYSDKSNMLKNILLLIGTILGVSALIGAFIAYSKKLKKAVKTQPQIYQEPEQSEFKEYIDNNLSQDSVDEEFDFDTPQEFDQNQNQEFTPTQTSEDFFERPNNIPEIFEETSEFEFLEPELEAIPDEDFIIEATSTPAAAPTITPTVEASDPIEKIEDIEGLYNDEEAADSSWGDDFSMLDEKIEQPTIDEIFDENEPEIIETPQPQPQQQPQPQPQPPQVHPIPEIVDEPISSTPKLGFDLQSSFNIDSSKSIHLIELDGKTSLIGTIDDDVFVLKTFNSILKTQIQARLYETNGLTNIYMVKVGSFKGLIDVATNAMGLTIEL